MSRQFHLPDLGEGVHEGQVLRLLIAAGDPVVEDQPIMEVETDKSAVEIPSPYAGTIAEWHVSEQQVVNVGDLMVTFGEAGGSPAAGAGTAAARAATASASAGATTAPAASASAPAAAPPTPNTGPASGDGCFGAGAANSSGTPAAGGTNGTAPRRRTPASPAVRSLARRLGLDLESIAGSGPGGRVLRRDVEAAAAAPATDAPSSAGVRPTAPEPGPRHDARSAAPAAPPATPATPAAAPPTTALAPVGRDASSAEPDGTPGQDDFGAVVRSPLSQTRKTIARVMSDAMRTIPHVTDCDDADVTELDTLRRQHNASVDPSRGVGMLPFVVRAVARALQAYPIFNASLDEAAGDLVYKRYVNIAIGMQTPRGLVAPVIRDADRKSVGALSDELAHLTEKARSGQFSREDAAGATYTISNAGAMGGSRYSTPIITPPQVAVLAVGRSKRLPWVIEDRVEPRLIMPLSHSMDHRVIDGAIEIAFMQHVIGDLQHPGRLLI